MHMTMLFGGGMLLGMMAAVNAMETGHARGMPAASMPMITADPMDFLDQVQELRRRELHARQEVSSAVDLTITLAPDATCGYLSGEFEVPITCTNEEQCAWAQIGDKVGDAGVIRCGTELRVECFESSKAVDTELCDDICQSGFLTLRCTDTDTPHCRTYAFPNGVYDYRCASTSVESVQSVEHIYEGQLDREFTTKTTRQGSMTESATGITQSEKSGNGKSKETDESSTVTGVAAPTSPSSNDNEDKKSSVPLGAIIGGAIGGVALIGAIMLGIFFMVRRKRNKNTPAPTEGPINPPTMSFAPQTFPSQNMNAGMLDSKMVGSPHEHRVSIVSPLGSPGWGGPVSPPPVYEAPAHEAQQVHEMGDSSVTR